jgi:hypothetical protein
MEASEKSRNKDTENKDNGEGLTEVEKGYLADSLKRHKVLLDRLSKR